MNAEEKELVAKYPHLSEAFDEVGNPREDVEVKRNQLFNDERRKALQTDEALTQTLHMDIWRAALYRLTRDAESRDVDLGINKDKWQTHITIAAFSDTLERISTLYVDQLPLNEGACFAPDYDPETEEMGEPFVGGHSVDFVEVTIHLAVRRNMWNEWDALDEKYKQKLANYIWQEMKQTLPYLADKEMGSWIDPDGDEHVYTHEIENEVEGWDVKVKKVESESELIRLCGKRFNPLHTLLNPDPIAPKEYPPRPYVDHGRQTHPIESTLSKFLTSQGYLVILEPEIYFPNPLQKNFRRPDLLVVDRGRSLMIEIDDMSHIWDPSTKEVELERWQRDRDLDRMLLCSGIPMLRIWHTEARKKPESVATKVAEAFASLGGKRLSYQ